MHLIFYLKISSYCIGFGIALFPWDRYKVDAITHAKTMVDPRITSLYTEAANLVGIDESREELVTRLTKGAAPSIQKKTVSVVGSGGLGKTTQCMISLKGNSIAPLFFRLAAILT